MRLRPFIEAEEAEQRNVKRTCELLEVSRAVFYSFAKHEPSARELSDAELKARIHAIYDESKGRYGAPKITGELRSQGVHGGQEAGGAADGGRRPCRAVHVALAQDLHRRP